jgi:predicted dehydrogenase
MNAFDGSFVAGSLGGIRLQPFSFHATIADVNQDSTVDLNYADYRWHKLVETEPNYDAYDGPQQHWIAAQQGRVPLLPTAELALQTMLISEGIYLSDKLGREVTAEEVKTQSKSSAVKV